MALLEMDTGRCDGQTSAGYNATMLGQRQTDPASWSSVLIHPKLSPLLWAGRGEGSGCMPRDIWPGMVASLQRVPPMVSFCALALGDYTSQQSGLLLVIIGYCKTAHFADKMP